MTYRAIVSRIKYKLVVGDYPKMRQRAECLKCIYLVFIDKIRMSHL